MQDWKEFEESNKIKTESVREISHFLNEEGCKMLSDIFFDITRNKILQYDEKKIIEEACSFVRIIDIVFQKARSCYSSCVIWNSDKTPRKIKIKKMNTNDAILSIHVVQDDYPRTRTEWHVANSKEVAFMGDDFELGRADSVGLFDNVENTHKIFRRWLASYFRKEYEYLFYNKDDAFIIDFIFTRNRIRIPNIMESKYEHYDKIMANIPKKEETIEKKEIESSSSNGAMVVFFILASITVLLIWMANYIQ